MLFCYDQLELIKKQQIGNPKIILVKQFATWRMPLTSTYKHISNNRVEIDCYVHNKYR